MSGRQYPDNIPSQKIIIPKGTINRDEVAVIEIPQEYKDEPVVVVTSKSSSGPTSPTGRSTHDSSLGLMYADQMETSFGSYGNASNARGGPPLPYRDNSYPSTTSSRGILSKTNRKVKILEDNSLGLMNSSQMSGYEDSEDRCSDILAQLNQTNGTASGSLGLMRSREIDSGFSSCPDNCRSNSMQSNESGYNADTSSLGLMHPDRTNYSGFSSCPNTSDSRSMQSSNTRSGTDQSSLGLMHPHQMGCGFGPRIDKCSTPLSQFGQTGSYTDNSSLGLMHSGQMNYSGISPCNNRLMQSNQSKSGQSSLGLMQSDQMNYSGFSPRGLGLAQPYQSRSGTEHSSLGLMHSGQMSSGFSGRSNASRQPLMHSNQSCSRNEQSSLGLMQSNQMDSGLGRCIDNCSTPNSQFNQTKSGHSSLGLMSSGEMGNFSSSASGPRCMHSNQPTSCSGQSSLGLMQSREMASGFGPCSDNRSTRINASNLSGTRTGESSLGLMQPGQMQSGFSSNQTGSSTGQDSLGLMQPQLMNDSFGQCIDRCGTKMNVSNLSCSSSGGNSLGLMRSGQMQSGYSSNQTGSSTGQDSLGLVQPQMMNDTFGQCIDKCGTEINVSNLSSTSSGGNSLGLMRSGQMPSGFSSNQTGSSTGQDSSGLMQPQMMNAAFGQCIANCSTKMNISNLSGTSSGGNSLGLMRSGQMRSGFSSNQTGSGTGQDSLGLLQSQIMDNSFGHCIDNCSTKINVSNLIANDTSGSSLGLMKSGQMHSGVSSNQTASTGQDSFGLLRQSQLRDSSFGQCVGKCNAKMNVLSLSGTGTGGSSLGSMNSGHMHSGFLSNQTGSGTYQSRSGTGQNSLGLLQSSQMNSDISSCSDNCVSKLMQSNQSGYSADHSSLGLTPPYQMNNSFGQNINRHSTPVPHHLLQNRSGQRAPCIDRCNTNLCQSNQSTFGTGERSRGLMKSNQMKVSFSPCQTCTSKLEKSHIDPRTFIVNQDGQSGSCPKHRPNAGYDPACQVCCSKRGPNNVAISNQLNQSSATQSGSSGLMQSHEMTTDGLTCFDKCTSMFKELTNNKSSSARDSSLGLMKSGEMKKDIKPNGQDKPAPDTDSVRSNASAKPLQQDQQSIISGTSAAGASPKPAEVDQRNASEGDKKDADENIPEVIVTGPEFGDNDSSLGILIFDDLDPALQIDINKSGAKEITFNSGVEVAQVSDTSSLGFMQSQQMNNTVGSSSGRQGLTHSSQTCEPCQQVFETSLGLMQSQQMNSTFGSDVSNVRLPHSSDRSSLGLMHSGQMNNTGLSTACGPCKEVFEASSSGLLQLLQMNSTFASDSAWPAQTSTPVSLGLIQAEHMNRTFGVGGPSTTAGIDDSKNESIPQEGAKEPKPGDQSSLGLMQSAEINSALTPDQQSSGDKSSLGLMQSSEMNSGLSSDANKSNAKEMHLDAAKPSTSEDTSKLDLPGQKCSPCKPTLDQSSLGLIKSLQMNSTFGSGSARLAQSGQTSTPASLGLMQSRQMNSTCGSGSARLGQSCQTGTPGSLGLMQSQQMDSTFGSGSARFAKPGQTSTPVSMGLMPSRQMNSTCGSDSARLGQSCQTGSPDSLGLMQSRQMDGIFGSGNARLGQSCQTSTPGSFVLMKSRQMDSTFGSGSARLAQSGLTSTPASLGLMQSRQMNSTCGSGSARLGQSCQTGTPGSLGLMQSQQMGSTFGSGFNSNSWIKADQCSVCEGSTLSDKSSLGLMQSQQMNSSSEQTSDLSNSLPQTVPTSTPKGYRKTTKTTIITSAPSNNDPSSSYGSDGISQPNRYRKITKTTTITRTPIANDNHSLGLLQSMHLDNTFGSPLSSDHSSLSTNRSQRSIPLQQMSNVGLSRSAPNNSLAYPYNKSRDQSLGLNASQMNDSGSMDRSLGLLPSQYINNSYSITPAQSAPNHSVCSTHCMSNSNNNDDSLGLLPPDTMNNTF